MFLGAGRLGGGVVLAVAQRLEGVLPAELGGQPRKRLRLGFGTSGSADGSHCSAQSVDELHAVPPLNCYVPPGFHPSRYSRRKNTVSIYSQCRRCQTNSRYLGG